MIEKAIILAAGRGSRLGEYTSNVPKCFVEVAGRKLIDWQVSALRKSGIKEIVIVGGYKFEYLEEYADKLFVNEIWHETNMLYSLLCAKSEIDNNVLISYSDIVYNVNIVKSLLSSKYDIALTYDTDWYALWKSRFEDPLSDAETFLIDDNFCITEIGNKTNDTSNINGQFMGLFSMNPASLEWVSSEIDEAASTLMDMTALFQKLIASEYPIHGIPITGGWTEVDDPADLQVAEQLFYENKIKI